MMTEELELMIDSIAGGGDGVGRANGVVAFVPRTAPGDRARISAVRENRLIRGRLIDLLDPSPKRVDPPCRHYTVDRCGGCQLQHMSYPAQLEAKSIIIRDALARIGAVDAVPPTVHGSDRQWRYRRKLTLALRRRGASWIAGLHPYDDPGAVFPLADCPITEESVVDAWRRVLAAGEHLPQGRGLRGAVRALDDGFSFTLEGGQRWAASAAFFAAVPGLTELWWKPESGRLRLLQSAGTDRPAGASFIQVNRVVADELRSHVHALAARRNPATVVDAYAGTGDLSARLAAGGARVVAIELDRKAAAIAASRLTAGSRAVAAPVEAVLAESLPADVVILNPPRAGVDAEVARVLREAEPIPAAIIYVSCNPATLARDIRRMERYRIAGMEAFDMFPQTAHVETVVELVPAA